VETGGNHSCLVSPKKPFIKCFGSNDFNQILAPVNKQLIQVSLGLKHSCALTVDHKITCWGLNFHAQSNPQFNSTVENSDSYYSYVTTGHFHTCAIKTVTLPGTDPINNNEGIKIKT